MLLLIELPFYFSLVVALHLLVGRVVCFVLRLVLSCEFAEKDRTSNTQQTRGALTGGETLRASTADSRAEACGQGYE